MRTIVIGLDGCSWNLLEPLLETGKLPNLESLRREGARGVLESSVPFSSGAGWTSYATASSPTQHGIYDFVLVGPTGRLQLAQQEDVRAKSYYRQLGEEGRSSVLINLPLDHDGCPGAVIVNSWLTIDEARRILPVGKRDRYSRLLEAYNRLPTDPSNVNELAAISRARFDLARELFLRERWDHFLLVFSATEWLGMAAAGAFLRGDESARAAFLQLYSDIDGYVGWFLERADGAATFVISDHGLVAERAVVRVNVLLEQLGFEGPVSGPGSVHLNGAGRGRTWSRRMLKRSLAPGSSRAPAERDPAAAGPVARAFMPSDAGCAVYAFGCDETALGEIRQALAELRFADGSRALDDVWSPAEATGNGSGAEIDPAVLFLPSAGVRPSALRDATALGPSPGKALGCRQRDGVILVGGDRVVSTDLERCSIYDVAPTILWTAGAAIPAGVDGRVLFEAFDDALVEALPVREGADGAAAVNRRHPGQHPDDAQSRLKALGYI